MKDWYMQQFVCTLGHWAHLKRNVKLKILHTVWLRRYYSWYSGQWNHMCKNYISDNRLAAGRKREQNEVSARVSLGNKNIYASSNFTQSVSGEKFQGCEMPHTGIHTSTTNTG